jgi:integrase
MPRKRERPTKRLYLKGERWYADFRDFADEGGGLEAMIPPGERFATKSRAEAVKLGKARHDELKAARRRGPAPTGVDLTRLGHFVDHHLEREASETQRPEAGLKQLEQQLETAVTHFGSEVKVRAIRTADIRGYLDRLRLDGLSPETQRKYLYALSKLLRRARAEEVVPMEHNPIAALVNKPGKTPTEREWLEIPRAALVLEAARLYQPRRKDLGVPYAYPLIACLLLTGGRPAEVMGLQVADLNFRDETIRFRKNNRRRLKTQQSRRTVRMWPQLKAVLLAYMQGADRPQGRFLFPSPDNPDRPLAGMKKLLAEIALRTGLQGELTPKVFRHTYCAARLQTTDNGHPVAMITVVEEMGHDSWEMVRDIYGHVGKVRRRADVVEYPLQPYMEELQHDLDKLRQLSPERNKHAGNLKNRVPLPVELAVLRAGLEQPDLGPRKIADKLQGEGIQVSPTGVRGVWQRHGLVLAEQRRAAAREERLNDLLQQAKLRAS